ncbi:putative CAF1 family ribonuclease [Leishmania utingensis]|uniref:CAF1 family ribonuclease n=1 Tax=Leishmania utingensis TaxID=653362 RepID=A0AAW2ZYB2_9TRYP
MEITNNNVGMLLPYMDTILRDCSFFTVDLEFSGIDRDRDDACAEAPEQAIRSLMRKPSDLYLAKLQDSKLYSIMQIGISVFTEVEVGDANGVSTANGATPSTVPSAAAHLKKEVADFLAAEVENYTAYAETTAVVERILSSANGSAKDFASAFKYLADQMLAVAQSLEMAARANSIRATEGPPLSSQSLPILWQRYHFLETLSHAVASYQIKSTAADVTVPLTPSTCYTVHTFSALMFPAATDTEVDVTLNIATAEFLAKNDMDFTRWVKEGLRFEPVKVAAAQLTKKVEAQLQEINLLTQPYTMLQGYKECIGRRLDNLLPLLPGELQLVRFILSLSSKEFDDPAAANLKQFYVKSLALIISFARGIVPESALPEYIYTKEKLYRAEMNALSAIGVTKANRRFVRTAVFNTWGNGCSSSLVSRSYGSDLLRTLLYATEVHRKPIVFYNGYTDVIFLLLALYGASSMPLNLQSFKSLAHRHFPSLFDTRILSCAEPLQGLGDFSGKLWNVVDEISNVSTIGPYVSFKFDSTFSGGCGSMQSSMTHNAAFDSLLTGKLFAFAKYGLENANTSVKVYENILSTYATLKSIYLVNRMDGMKRETAAVVYYISNKPALRVDIIRKALESCKITAVILFRGHGYTVQPIGAACQMPNLVQTMIKVLSAKVHEKVELYQIELRTRAAIKGERESNCTGET